MVQASLVLCGGIYQINIDSNADAQADAAFTFVFSELKEGKQTGTAYYATGPQVREPEPAGDVLIRGSFAVGQVAGITGFRTFAQVWTWLAVAVSLFVFAGLFRSSGQALKDW